MLPLASCPVAQMNQSNTPYLLRHLFYELGHFDGYFDESRVCNPCGRVDFSPILIRPALTMPAAARVAMPVVVMDPVVMDPCA